MKKCKNVFGTIFGFTIGTIIASITATYAATTLSSKNVYYDNSNSGGSSTNVAGAIDELYATADDQDILKKEIIDTIYPVGSVYITTTESKVEDVVARFGGTWQRYATDTTLVGYKEGTNTINATGGSKTVTLSNANLPSHSHDVTAAGTVTSKFTGTRSLSESTGSGYTISHTYSNRTIGSSGAHSHTAYIETIESKVAKGSDYSRIASDGTNVSGVVNIAANGGAHTHTYADYYANSISGVAAHQHYYTAAGTVSSSFTGTKVTSTTTGSGTAVNVQDPYTVVYMYKRTA